MRFAKSIRLDQLLVVRGLAVSRTQAKALIESGLVKVGGRLALKASQIVSAAETPEVIQHPRYVSRGGLKLEAAISGFELDFVGTVVLDVGASTGGFTDCALQAGAARVVCVDVGTGQLHDEVAAGPEGREFRAAECSEFGGCAASGS